MNSRKPTWTKPNTPSTRATMASGNWREKTATARVHKDSISAHRSKEPSCPPHVAANRYCMGNRVLECCAT